MIDFVCREIRAAYICFSAFVEEARWRRREIRAERRREARARLDLSMVEARRRRR